MINRVWVLGDAVIDWCRKMPTVISNARRRAATWQVGIARLGGDSAFIGRVGQDGFGAFCSRC